MLARRELSEAQVRQRLARRGFDADSIDEAIDRLKQERAIDDVRTAEAIARSETTLKHRGPVRVRRQIEHAGIASSTARRAVDDLFESVDDSSLLEASLAKRLRRQDTIQDERQYARLYRYLLAQGFEADHIVRALNARSVK
jgi:regulatory protein